MVKKLSSISWILSLTFLLAISFAFAAHVITTSSGGTSFSVTEDTSFNYNISVNNSDLGVISNITQVNITIPSSFSFLSDSNGTDAGTHTFTNTTTILSWDGDGLVMDNSTNFFWFNATTVTPGSYNITVSTTNSTGTQSTNLSVTVNDTTSPSSIEFVSPTPADNANLSQANVSINITAEDNGELGTIIVRLYNSSNSEINTSTSSTSPLFETFVGLLEGVYYFNATVNDTYGNSNDTATRTVTLDVTDPVVTTIAPVNATSSTNTSYNFTFNVTDTNAIQTCSVILGGTSSGSTTSVNSTGGTNGITVSSISAATYAWYVSCTDFAGNVGNSSNKTLTVTAASSSSSSGSSSSSSSNPVTDYSGYTAKSYTFSSNNVSEGFTQDNLWKSDKVKFSVKGEQHSITIDDLTSDNVTFTLSPTLQTITLEVGESIEVDLGEDGLSDLLIRADSIVRKRVTLFVQEIEFEAPEEVVVVEEPAPEVVEEFVEEEPSSKAWLWVLVVVVILALIGGGYYFIQKNNR